MVAQPVPAVRARPPAGGPAHVPALDGLRGVAVWAVVAFHAAVVATDGAAWAYREPPPTSLWPAFGGFLGVDLFFVLSGFLLARSWSAVREREARLWTASTEYARRRARRILPPFLACLAVLVPLRVPEWLTTPEGWLKLGLFGTVQQFLVTDLPREVNAVMWSLTTEVHFYALLPLVAWALRRRRHALLGAALALSIGWRIAVGPTGGMAEWLPGRLDQFVAGMVAAQLVADGGRGRLGRILTGPHAAWTLGLPLGVLTIGAGALRLVQKPDAWGVLLHPVAGVCMAGLLVRVLLTGRTRLLEARWLRTSGTISYSLYLWHWPVMTQAARAGWFAGPDAGVGMVLALASCVGVSAVSWWLTERPFLPRRPARELQPA